MNATFYNYTGNPKKIKKDLGTGTNVSNFKPFEDFSEQNPYLIIGYNATIYGCNYAKIDGHFYFITDRVLQVGNRMQLTCKKDVITDCLTNNNASIVALPVIVERSKTEYNSYISDSLQRSQVNYTTYSIPFDTDFSLSGTIIVAAIGGE